MRIPRTWILIADAGHARVLESERPGQRLARIEGLDVTADLPPTRELVRDRQARGHNSVGSARHAIEPKSDPRRNLEQSFARSLVETLAGRRNARDFDRLVIVAPPAMLAMLREEMPKSLGDHVCAEVAKDLVKTPDIEIRRHLEGIVAI
jgi:protein required for attachment to host cells